MAELGVYQGQEQRQEMQITPRQMQSLEILAAPMMELQQKISQELSENPVLELEDPDVELPDIPDPAEHIQPGSEKDDMEDELARIVELAASGVGERENDYEFSYGNSPDDEERRDYFFNSIAGEISMQEQLLEQLNLSDAAEDRKRIAEAVIGGIDETGYLKTHEADLATGCGCSLQEAEQAIALVQSFDPPGIGARTPAECLKIQLERMKCKDKTLFRIVQDHLEDIAANRLPAVAKKLNLTLDELKEKISFLRKLNPYPGNAFAEGKVTYIEPDVFVEADGDDFNVYANTSYIPRLRISKTYLKMLEDPSTPSETRTWLKSRLTNGKGLLKALEQRESTILRIARVIVSDQYDFLRNGVESLKPMTMKQVADKLNLHETTISRAIAGKYMKTPVGLFEFRYFFTTGFKSGEGEDVSSRSVMALIRQLVDEENPAVPLSDSKLTALLKERGLPVARRTVAKYREELGIPSSHLRRVFE